MVFSAILNTGRLVKNSINGWINDTKQFRKKRKSRMQYKAMKQLSEKIWKELQQARDAGQKEYAHHNDNVFANFERVAERLNISPKKVLMVYLLKHIDGITAYIEGHKSQREDVRGRITDSIVYLILLWGMIEEENGKVH
jgi:hypothetical protein|tara:strand:- start:892 stop:1311 length:420 start_codon:yes stop_codon:yes gene_type:complete